MACRRDSRTAASECCVDAGEVIGSHLNLELMIAQGFDPSGALAY